MKSYLRLFSCWVIVPQVSDTTTHSKLWFVTRWTSWVRPPRSEHHVNISWCQPSHQQPSGKYGHTGESWILQIILTALLAGYGVLCPSLPLIWVYCHPIRCSSDYIGEQITQWIPRNKSRFVRLKQVSSCWGEIIWELEKFKLNFISKPSFTQFA